VSIVAHLVVTCISFKLFVIRTVKPDTLFKHVNEVLDWFKFPKIVATFGFRVDEVLAASDHLVGQLAE
jgi:hypothetical protein